MTTVDTNKVFVFSVPTFKNGKEEGINIKYLLNYYFRETFIQKIY